MIRTRCKECGSVYEVKRIQDAAFEPVSFCIFCGSTELVTGDEDSDYWNLLAKDLGLKEGSGDIVEAMFVGWKPTEGDPRKFLDYARELMRSAREENGIKVN